MSHNYDNWERLVRAVLLKEELREIAMRDSLSTISIPMMMTTMMMMNLRGPAVQFILMINYLHRYDVSFSLEKKTGKNCFMVGATGLVISEKHHKLVSYSQSRFLEAAELVKYDSQPINIKGRIEIQRLSPDTVYGAYLVFKLKMRPTRNHDESVTFQYDSDFLNLFLKSAVATISFLGHIVTTRKLNVVDRGDGWKEVKCGNFFVVNEGKQSGEVEVQFVMAKNFLETPPIVEGIEFRPTSRRSHSFGTFR